MLGLAAMTAVSSLAQHPNPGMSIDLQTGNQAFRLPTSEAAPFEVQPVNHLFVTESDGKEDKEKTVDQRVADIEKELKKARESEAKKKADDATKPAVKPRGRLHTDINFFDQSNLNRAVYGDIQDGTYFRRARLGFDAKAFEIMSARLDFEMASGGGRPSIFDAYVKVSELPVINNIQVGHFREPFSLEALTSSNWFTFIERAMNNTFDPSRNWGIMTNNWSEDERLTWGVGLFQEGSDTFGDDIGDTGEWAGTGRLTYLLYWDEPTQGRFFWEVGASYSYRRPDHAFAVNSNSGPPSGAETSIVSYSARPEDNLNEDGIGRVPSMISVSVPNADHINLFGIESSLNWGPLNIQGEYICSNVSRSGAPDLFFHGAYIQGSFFLTGESRQWDKQMGYFTRAQVFENFFYVDTDNGRCLGRGAWEVAARWNYLDLTDGAIGANYGYMQSTTLGLNWYLSPYMRWMFNYEYSDPQRGATGAGGNVQVWHARWDTHW